MTTLALPQGRKTASWQNFNLFLPFHIYLGLHLLVGQRFAFWLHLSPDSASQLKGLDNHELGSLWTSTCAPYLRPQTSGSAPFQTSSVHSNNLKFRGWPHPIHCLDDPSRLHLTSHWNYVDWTPQSNFL